MHVAPPEGVAVLFHLGCLMPPDIIITNVVLNAQVLRPAAYRNMAPVVSGLTNRCTLKVIDEPGCTS